MKKNQPSISKITKFSDKNDQFHGNYCVSAELDDGCKIYYHNVKYKRTTLHVSYPSGANRTFEENSHRPHFQDTKYCNVVKQIYTEILKK